MGREIIQQLQGEIREFADGMGDLLHQHANWQQNQHEDGVSEVVITSGPIAVGDVMRPQKRDLVIEMVRRDVLARVYDQVDSRDWNSGQWELIYSPTEDSVRFRGRYPASRFKGRRPA